MENSIIVREGRAGCSCGNDSPETHRGADTKVEWRSQNGEVRIQNGCRNDRALGTRFEFLKLGCLLPQFFRRARFERARWSPHDSIPATAGLVFRPSTGAEIRHFFAWPKHRCLGGFRGFGHLAVDLLEIVLYPAHAANFNLSIARDPENRGHVG